jgi:hypothetical protein
MGKVAEFKKPAPRTDLAAEVAPKLEAAKARLVELEAHAAEAALAVALNEMGAATKLTEINVQVDAAGRAVLQPQAALDLARQRDAMAAADADTRARRVNLAAMQKHAASRLAAMQECCEALETASKAYAAFLAETDALAESFFLACHVFLWAGWGDELIDKVRSSQANICRILLGFARIHPVIVG